MSQRNKPISRDDLWDAGEDSRRVKWTCMFCNHSHIWYWSLWDVFEGILELTCDNCNHVSKQNMKVNPIIHDAWCEPVKELNTQFQEPYWKRFENLSAKDEIEELKKHVKQVQQRIEDLQEIERQKNKTLHNLIARWEFEYSGKLEQRILQSKNDENVTYRDLVADEIDKLIRQIDEWLDYQTYLIENSQMNYVHGWNDCIESIKKRLTGPYDFYEFHKVNGESNE